MSEITPYSSTGNPVIRLAQYNALLDHGLEKGAVYIVRVNGSYYEAIQGGGSSGAGTIVYGGASNVGGVSGSDASAVMQAAVNGLTAARTWKEKVVLKGLFIMNTTVSVPSQTIVDRTQAAIVAGPSLTGSCFFEYNNVTNIEVYGGFFSGNASSPVYLPAVYGYPENIYQNTVDFLQNAANNIKILGVHTDHSWTTVDIYGGCFDIEVAHCVSYKNAADFGVVADTADIYSINIHDNTSRIGYDDAVACLTETAGYHNIYDVNIHGNMIDKTGVSLASGYPCGVKLIATVGTITNVRAHGNTFSNFPKGFGTYVHGATKVRIRNNDFINMSPNGSYCLTSGGDIQISNNTYACDSASSMTRPILCENISGIRILNNDIWGYGEAQFGLIDFYNVSHSMVKGNYIRGTSLASSHGIDVHHSSDDVEVIGNDVGLVPIPIFAYDSTNFTIARNVINNAGVASYGQINLGGTCTGYLLEHNRIKGTNLGSNIGIRTWDACDAGIIRFNKIEAVPSPIILAHAADKVYGNTGYITENSGSSAIASGTTAIQVTHGLSITPNYGDILITPTNNPTSDPGNIWLTAADGTVFNVNCRTNPGASGMSFNWAIRPHMG